MTKSKSIIIGTAVSNRDQLELENQIGLYVNTLPFKTIIDPELTLIDFIASEHNRIQNILRHQNYPFDKIVDDLNHIVPHNRNPLFDVGFTYNPNQIEIIEDKLSLDNEASIQVELKGKHTVKSDLWFHAFNQKERLRIEIEYSIDLFETSNVKRIIRLLSYVLTNDLWTTKLRTISSKVAEVEALKRKKVLELRKSQNLARLTNS